MLWEKPDFESIEMNAEIGGYQSDFDEPVQLNAPLETESAAPLEPGTETRVRTPPTSELADPE